MKSRQFLIGAATLMPLWCQFTAVTDSFGITSCHSVNNTVSQLVGTVVIAVGVIQGSESSLKYIYS